MALVLLSPNENRKTSLVKNPLKILHSVCFQVITYFSFRLNNVFYCCLFSLLAFPHLSCNTTSPFPTPYTHTHTHPVPPLPHIHQHTQHINTHVHNTQHTNISKHTFLICLFSQFLQNYGLAIMSIWDVCRVKNQETNGKGEE
jgi:hypothetical protein